jgi:hypothetical protein
MDLSGTITSSKPGRGLPPTKAACLTGHDGSVEGGIRRGNRRRILSWSDHKGISTAAKCFCVKTGVIGLEWNYKLIACFARYVEIVSDVRCEDY